MNKKEIRHYVVCNLSYAVTHTLIETKLYSKVIKNIINSFLEFGGSKKSLISFIQKLNEYRYLDNFLWDAFVWSGTIEGHDYWLNIENKYRNYIIRF